jgi:hypothetical protein
MAERKPTPDEQVRQLYEETESKLASAAEELVGRSSFAEILSRLTENAMAVTRIGNDVLDLAVRNLRLASRHDVTRLATQLARTEDKLELVLQHVEELEGSLDVPTASDGRGSRSRASTTQNGRRRSRSSGGGSRGARSGKRSGTRRSPESS